MGLPQIDMVVSWNGGIPKSSILKGFDIKYHPLIGVWWGVHAYLVASTLPLSHSIKGKGRKTKPLIGVHPFEETSKSVVAEIWTGQQPRLISETCHCQKVNLSQPVPSHIEVLHLSNPPTNTLSKHTRTFHWFSKILQVNIFSFRHPISSHNSAPSTPTDQKSAAQWHSTWRRCSSRTSLPDGPRFPLRCRSSGSPAASLGAWWGPSGSV